jgi:hypothetical protein
MSIDQKILEEIKRYNSINKYIMEQEAELPPAPEAELPPAPGETPAGDLGVTPPAEPTSVDIESDPDVEKLDGDMTSTETSEGGSEELDITDLVNSQKNIESKQENYFDDLFKQLTNLESKLSAMDSVMAKLNDLEVKIEKSRPKTPEEKLELRSLDSGPYNQKLSDFFDDKMVDMEKSGKNEYVLTSDEVTDFTPSEIQKSFKNFGDDEEIIIPVQ